jgi:hypothetical protein
MKMFYMGAESQIYLSSLTASAPMQTTFRRWIYSLDEKRASSLSMTIHDRIPNSSKRENLPEWYKGGAAALYHLSAGRHESMRQVGPQGRK